MLELLPAQVTAVLLVSREAGGMNAVWLFLAQNMEYKFIELLSCDFLQSSEEVIRQQMAFRYNSLKSKLALMHVSA